MRRLNGYVISMICGCGLLNGNYVQSVQDTRVSDLYREAGPVRGFKPDAAADGP